MRWFLAGLGVGVTLGVAFAPATVVEQRRRWTSSAARNWERMRERDAGDLMTGAGEEVVQVAGSAQEPAGEVDTTTTELVIPAGAIDPLLDFLNTASEEQLLAVKGIGPKTAQQILAGRPYEMIEGLVGRASKAQIEAVREQLTNEPTI